VAIANSVETTKKIQQSSFNNVQKLGENIQPDAVKIVDVLKTAVKSAFPETLEDLVCGKIQVKKNFNVVCLKQYLLYDL